MHVYLLSPRAYEPLLSSSNDQYTGQQWPSKAKKRSVHKDKFNGIRHNQDSRAFILLMPAHQLTLVSFMILVLSVENFTVTVAS